MGYLLLSSVSKAVYKPFNYSDEIRGYAIAVARVVVVGVAVVVDIAEVGSVRRGRRRKPPVVTRSVQ